MFFLPMLPIFFVPLLSGFSSGGSFPKPLAKEKEQQLLLRLRDGTDAEKESAKSCKKAIQYIGTEHCLFDIKTHHQGTLSVSTDRIQFTG